MNRPWIVQTPDGKEFPLHCSNVKVNTQLNWNGNRCVITQVDHWANPQGWIPEDLPLGKFKFEILKIN